MRRAFVDGLLAADFAHGAQVLGQLLHHGLELVDAARLLVDGLVQRVDQVFHVRQLDFNIDKTVFVFHGRSLLKQTL